MNTDPQTDLLARAKSEHHRILHFVGTKTTDVLNELITELSRLRAVPAPVAEGEGAVLSDHLKLFNELLSVALHDADSVTLPRIESIRIQHLSLTAKLNRAPVAPWTLPELPNECATSVEKELLALRAQKVFPGRKSLLEMPLPKEEATAHELARKNMEAQACLLSGKPYHGSQTHAKIADQSAMINAEMIAAGHETHAAVNKPSAESSVSVPPANTPGAEEFRDAEWLASLPPDIRKGVEDSRDDDALDSVCRGIAGVAGARLSEGRISGARSILRDEIKRRLAAVEAKLAQTKDAFKAIADAGSRARQELHAAEDKLHNLAEQLALEKMSLEPILNSRESLRGENSRLQVHVENLIDAKKAAEAELAELRSRHDVLQGIQVQQSQRAAKAEAERDACREDTELVNWDEAHFPGKRYVWLGSGQIGFAAPGSDECFSFATLRETHRAMRKALAQPTAKEGTPV